MRAAGPILTFLLVGAVPLAGCVDDPPAAIDLSPPEDPLALLAAAIRAAEAEPVHVAGVAPAGLHYHEAWEAWLDPRAKTLLVEYRHMNSSRLLWYTPTGSVAVEGDRTWADPTAWGYRRVAVNGLMGAEWLRDHGEDGIYDSVERVGEGLVWRIVLDSTRSVVVQETPPRLLSAVWSGGGDHPAAEQFEQRWNYEAEPRAPPETAVRALALAYDRERRTDPEGATETVYAFRQTGLVPVSEVEVRVRVEGWDDGEPRTRVTRSEWSMRLTERSRAQDGVVVSFDDTDGDGLVSRGDELTMRSPGVDAADAVSLILYDERTGASFDRMNAPGAAFGAVLALAGVALARRSARDARAPPTSP